MSEPVFVSSDSIRTARPLQHAQVWQLPGPLALACGDTLTEVHVTYETWGTLNANGDNAVMICHAISGDSHVTAHDAADDTGWWDLVVGPDKPVDTNQYFVVCANVLGGCRGTTGPGSVNPATGKPYGRAFPRITIRDMVEVQKRLLESLHVRKLALIMGGSFGGHQALTWATAYPDWVAAAAIVASSPRLTSQALAFDVVGRNAIYRDPGFHDGQYYDDQGPTVGLALARMLGHITYLSRQAMQEKFRSNRTPSRAVPSEFELQFEVGSYLAYQGQRFVERFDANSYAVLTLAMDMFNLGDTHEELTQALARSQCRWLVLSFSSDWLFPPEQSQDMVRALLAAGRTVSYCNVASACGHDAFLLQEDFPVYGELIRSFARHSAPALQPLPADSAAQAGRRDYELLLDLIPPGASLLDLGCGEGGLLTRYIQRERAASRALPRVVGVELGEPEIIACARQGLAVVQADLNHGLADFHDGEFDVVVLSQTLQAVQDVQQLMREMLRVGRRCIVSFPNVACQRHVERLLTHRRAPQTTADTSTRWYNTPNIRMLSIADFRDFCADMKITIHRGVFLDTVNQRRVETVEDSQADLAIFVVSA